LIDARVPDHYDAEVLGLEDSAPWLISVLLEEGSTNDLRWLIDRFGLDALREWFEQRGGRQLSRRNRAFWRIVLDTEAHPDERGGSDLWPL